MIFEEIGKREFATAIDENGLNWIRIPTPSRYNGMECWNCEQPIIISEGYYWYSVSESVPYCHNCVTLPTVESE